MLLSFLKLKKELHLFSGENIVKSKSNMSAILSFAFKLTIRDQILYGSL